MTTLYHPAHRRQRQEIEETGLTQENGRAVFLMARPPEDFPEWMDVWEVEVDGNLPGDDEIMSLSIPVSPENVRLFEAERVPSLAM